MKHTKHPELGRCSDLMGACEFDGPYSRKLLRPFVQSLVPNGESLGFVRWFTAAFNRVRSLALNRSDRRFKFKKYSSDQRDSIVRTTCSSGNWPFDIRGSLRRVRHVLPRVATSDAISGMEKGGNGTRMEADTPYGRAHSGPNREAELVGEENRTALECRRNELKRKCRAEV